VTNCANCAHPLSPHQACFECGFYKGKKVLRTKLERTLKRGEAAQRAKVRQQTAQPQEAPGHEDHGHGHSEVK
jgi:hypothetical protein